MAELPTPDEMLDNAEENILDAYRFLDAAADWLRSDWHPVGSALTPDQAERRMRLRAAVTAGKHAIRSR